MDGQHKIGWAGQHKRKDGRNIREDGRGNIREGSDGRGSMREGSDGRGSMREGGSTPGRCLPYHGPCLR